jgi:putative ABC transport system permease protein
MVIRSANGSSFMPSHAASWASSESAPRQTTASSQSDGLRTLRPTRVVLQHVVGRPDDVRAHGALADIRQLVRKRDPTIPIYDVKTMDEVLAQSVAAPRFSTAMVVVFSFVALALAAIGTYGVVSYAVGQRTQEIGLRLALGAQRADVLKMAVGNGLAAELLAIAVGFAISFGVTRFMHALLFGVAPTDPITLLAVPLILIGVAILACYAPARRATRVDPIVALRYE